METNPIKSSPTFVKNDQNLVNEQNNEIKKDYKSEDAKIENFSQDNQIVSEELKLGSAQFDVQLFSDREPADCLFPVPLPGVKPCNPPLIPPKPPSSGPFPEPKPEPKPPSSGPSPEPKPPSSGPSPKPYPPDQDHPIP